MEMDEKSIKRVAWTRPAQYDEMEESNYACCREKKLCRWSEWPEPDGRLRELWERHKVGHAEAKGEDL